MQDTKFIWRNGKFVPWFEANIHVLSHGLHYGSGVFEGIRVYKTKSGSSIFRLEEHVERLFNSANAICLEIPFSKESIATAIKETVAINCLEEGYIRPLVFSGYGEMGISHASTNPVEVAIACWPWGHYHVDKPLDIKTSSYIRIHPNSTKVEAKICGHYVNSILAMQEIIGTKYHEVLMLDCDGFVSECSSANIFIIKNNILYTPTLGTILSGITRNFVIKLAIDLGYEVVEKHITLDDVYNADEAFFTGTAVEIAPIGSLDDRNIGTDNSYPISNLIKEHYKSVVHGESTTYENYLTKVAG